MAVVARLTASVRQHFIAPSFVAAFVPCRFKKPPKVRAEHPLHMPAPPRKPDSVRKEYQIIQFPRYIEENPTINPEQADTIIQKAWEKLQPEEMEIYQQLFQDKVNKYTEEFEEYFGSLTFNQFESMMDDWEATYDGSELLQICVTERRTELGLPPKPLVPFEQYRQDKYDAHDPRMHKYYPEILARKWEQKHDIYFKQPYR